MSKPVIFNADCMLESLGSLWKHQCWGSIPDQNHWSEVAGNIGYDLEAFGDCNM